MHGAPGLAGNFPAFALDRRADVLTDGGVALPGCAFAHGVAPSRCRKPWPDNVRGGKLVPCALLCGRTSCGENGGPSGPGEHLLDRLARGGDDDVGFRLGEAERRRKADDVALRSEEHTSELQTLMRNTY